MNKVLLIVSLLFFTLISCQKEEKILLPANKVYIMATHVGMPDYDEEGAEFDLHKCLKTLGVVEVSQDMIAKIIRTSERHFWGDNYFSADMHLSDSLKKSLVQLVEECQQDTVFQEEYIGGIYDGPLFFIMIEKEDEERIIVHVDRDAECPQYVSAVLNVLLNYEEIELKNIVYMEEAEARKILDEKTKVYPKSFMKMPGMLPPPPPLRSTVKFVPPIILPDE